MIRTRAAAALLAILVGVLPVCARARTGLPTMQIVASARIAAVAERIARSLVSDPERALAPAFLIADQSVPLGAVALTSGVPLLNSTYVGVPVSITIDGRVVRTVYAGYHITSFIQTAVAAHDLAPDTILQADDLTTARMPYTGRPALDVSTFVGRKVRVVVAHGAVLYPELTVVNELVRAGMPALFIVHDGPVKLAADVVARTGGGLGDYVTIYDPQTQKALSGVVTGPGTVELTLPGENF
jgi:flagella basal body P-ring formation protein FlgA